MKKMVKKEFKQVISQHPLEKKGLISLNIFQLNSELVIQNKKRLVQWWGESIKCHKHLNEVTKERKRMKTVSQLLFGIRG